MLEKITYIMACIWLFIGLFIGYAKIVEWEKNTWPVQKVVRYERR